MSSKKFTIMFHNQRTGKIVYGVRKYDLSTALKLKKRLDAHKTIKHYLVRKEK